MVPRDAPLHRVYDPDHGGRTISFFTDFIYENMDASMTPRRYVVLVYD
jgi:hypothetical protein